jgi:hypothetical protein
MNDLAWCQNQKGKKGVDRNEAEKKNAVEQARQEMDSYNRYTIFVRGASSDTYGILKRADVEEAFNTLLTVTMLPPATQGCMIQHMHPLERLGERSAHTAWMAPTKSSATPLPGSYIY